MQETIEMKKILSGGLLFLSGILSSCSSNYFAPFDRVCRVDYRLSANYLQTPAETKRLRTGDCNDKAYLLLSEWKRKGIEGKLVGGKFMKNDVESHAWCEVIYNGETVIFDPTMRIVMPKKYFDKFDMYIGKEELDFDQLTKCMKK